MGLHAHKHSEPVEQDDSFGPTDPASRPVRVVVLDDQPLFRSALIDVLRASGRAEVIGEFSEPPELIAALDTLDPDVCVIDLSSSETDSIVVLKQVCGAKPSTRVLMLTTDDESDRAWRMLEEGAAGVAIKNAEAEELADAVIRVAMGEAIIPERLHRGITEQIRSRRIESRSHLSDREIEILSEVAAGFSASEIASDLSLAESTVKTHLTRIYDKLGVSERAAAVAEAMRRGIIE